MIKYIKFSIVLSCLVFFSCEDVIDVEVPEATPKLVIEASLDWEKGTLGNEQTIYLSMSTPYFSETKLSPVTNASVKVTNASTGITSVFTHQNEGAYITTDFIPVEGQKYTLEIMYNNETYMAEETLQPVVTIDEMYQSTDNGFDKEALELNVSFTDPVAIDNYYLLKFQQKGNYLPELFDITDEFTDGNQMDVFLEDEDFVAGNEVSVNLYGVSKQYYNYIRLLIEQAQSGGPFATIPAQLKGNCINKTTPENYAFGYFRLAEVVKKSYTFN